MTWGWKQTYLVCDRSVYWFACCYSPPPHSCSYLPFNRCSIQYGVEEEEDNKECRPPFLPRDPDWNQWLLVTLLLISLEPLRCRCPLPASFFALYRSIWFSSDFVLLFKTKMGQDLLSYQNSCRPLDYTCWLIRFLVFTVPCSGQSQDNIIPRLPHEVQSCRGHLHNLSVTEHKDRKE